MDARLNEEGMTVPPSVALTEVNKAFITLTYPGKQGSGMPLEDALRIARVVEPTASLIKKDVESGDYGEARMKFVKYNQDASMRYRDTIYAK